MTTTDFRTLVHTPADLAIEYLDWARYIQENEGIKFGINSVDRVVTPMRPGQLVSIIARPGHGKTSIMAALARYHARNLQRTNATGQAIIYVTWEQSAEELEAFFHADGLYSATDIAWGKADLEIIKGQSVKRGALPIWIIGHGIGRIGKKVPIMTPEAVLGAIETMQADYNVKPALMLFDYMQLVPVPHFRDRVQRVTEVPILIKQLALRIGCPAIVGVQASRDVDGKKEKLPELASAQWASSIEQTSDKVFSSWRPILTEDVPYIELADGMRYENNSNLFILRLLKQRGGIGRYTWALHFDMATLKLAELELQKCETGEW